MRTALAVAIVLAGTRRAAADEPIPISVSRTEVECPDRPELSQSLSGQGFRVVDGGPVPLIVEIAQAEGELILTLRDGTARILLYRVLPAGECAEVADTVALLVERRVHELGSTVDREDPPPAAPAPVSTPHVAPEPSWAVDAAGGVGLDTGIAGESPGAGPRFASRLALPRLFHTGIGAGWLHHAAVEAGSGLLDVDRLVFDVGIGIGLRRSRWELEGEPRLEVEALHASSRGLERNESRWGSALRAGAATRFGWRVSGPFWLSIEASALVLASGLDLRVAGTGSVGHHAQIDSGASLSLGRRFEL